MTRRDARASFTAMAMGRILLTAALLLAGCREEAAEQYLSISGPAPDLDGLPRRGAVLVVFWASWCAPCVRETPSLLSLAESAPGDLRVHVVSQDEQRTTSEAALGPAAFAAIQLTMDAGGEAARQWGVTSLPGAVLVVDGRLVARFAGAREWNARSMRRLLARLVERPADSPR